MGAKLSAQMKLFDLSEVKLKEGPFKKAQDVDLKYILALDPDRLLAPYLLESGLPPKADRYGNWESIGLDGHIGGHYLSALAMMYASTGNKGLKDRLDYMLSELARCQAKNGNGYVGGIPQGKVFGIVSIKEILTEAVLDSIILGFLFITFTNFLLV